MAPAGKALGFYHEANDWFCNAGLPSDITIVIDKLNFHLHKFPLTSRCGKIKNLIEKTQSTDKSTSTITLENIPGGTEAFLIAAKFCYGIRVELTPRNIIMVYCVADYLEMIDDYGEDNLFSTAESYFHKNVLKNWKDCIISLQNCENFIRKADDFQIISKILNAISMMVCTDASLFGWPMMMYGRLQSPGGSILWNGINTGAKIRSLESEWWFEDVSYFSVDLFERLVKTMEGRGIRPEKLTGAIMYYARKHLHGLGRWQGGQSTKTRSITSFSMKPAIVDQKLLLESIIKLLPQKKGKSFCRFLLGLLRVALILNVNEKCQDFLEKKIGMQLEFATLDGLLIPSYSDSDTLYNVDFVERVINHFLTSESQQMVTTFSPLSFELEASPLTLPLRKVSKLVDSYMAEIASDVNLKPEKMRSLAEALPESSRSLTDGLYRAFDIYFKAHPWLPEKEKEGLCNIIDYQKLSIDACSHASQNERLPLRATLQALFFEQMQLRTALAATTLNEPHHRTTPTSALTMVPTGATATANHIVQRDGWLTIVRENNILRVSMERMRSRVGELELEFNKMKHEMKRASKTHSFLVKSFGGCKRIPRSDSRGDVVESTGPATPRGSTDRGRASHHSKNRKSFSLFS